MSRSVLLPSLAGLTSDVGNAVMVDGEAMSREQLAARAGAVAARLAGVGAAVVPGASRLDTVVAVVAGLMAGVPVAPVPSDAGAGERAHIVKDSGAEVVLGNPDWPDVDLPRIRLDAGPNSSGWRDVPPEHPGLIMYTSGTTGLPKGVVLPRRAIAACLDGLADAWAWTPDDTLVHGLPLFHVHGLILGVLGPLRVGSRLIHTGKPSPERYAAASGTVYFGVPTVWSRVCADTAAARALSSARLLVSGSAPLPVPVFQALVGLTGLAPIERYGMTETIITISTRAAGERRPGWVGTPIRGVRSRLGAEDGSVVPTDGATIGELQIAGDTLFDHYLNRPEATAESFTEDGFFRTGDAAVIDAEGFHRIVGRQSIDIIKTGGYKVGAGEVESSLLECAGVSECAVVGLPDADLGERIVAFVVGDGVTERQLIEYVAGQLSVHKRPREVRLVTELPRNAMGKVQKTVLRDRG